MFTLDSLFVNFPAVDTNCNRPIEKPLPVAAVKAATMASIATLSRGLVVSVSHQSLLTPKWTRIGCNPRSSQCWVSGIREGEGCDQKVETCAIPLGALVAKILHSPVSHVATLAKCGLIGP